MPTQKDIDDAKAFRQAIEYLIERAEKRLQFRFDDYNREPMAMLALLNASFDMAKRYKDKEPARFEAMRAVFMSAIGKITGAHVEQIVEQPDQPVDWTHEDQAFAEKLKPRKDVH